MRAPTILPFLRMPQPTLKAATIDMLRAYLLTACLAAVVMELAVVVAIVSFGCSEETFQTRAFRLTVLLILFAVVLATRQIAGAAFRYAVAHRYATLGGASSETVAVQTVTVSPACPRRPLVVLHLRLNRRLSQLAER